MSIAPEPNPFAGSQSTAFNPFQFLQSMMGMFTQSNPGLEVMKEAHNRGLLGVPISPKNYGGADNPDLRGLTGETDQSFFRTPEQRDARVAQGQSYLAREQNYGAPAVTSRIQQAQQFPQGSDYRQALLGRAPLEPGSLENPLVSPNGARLVRLPNGSWGMGGQQVGPMDTTGNEDIAGLIQEQGVIPSPQEQFPDSPFDQASAMDAQQIRQQQIQQQLQEMLGGAQSQQAQGPTRAPQRSQGPMSQEEMDQLALELERDFGDGSSIAPRSVSPRTPESEVLSQHTRNQIQQGQQAEQSIGDLEQRLTQLQAEHKNTLNPDRRLAISEEIRELTKQKEVVEPQVFDQGELGMALLREYRMLVANNPALLDQWMAQLTPEQKVALEAAQQPSPWDYYDVPNTHY